MAVLQMQRINICTLKKNRKPLLELLQRKGVIEINDDIPEDNVFHKMDMSSAEGMLIKNISLANDALDLLHKYAKDNTSLLSVLEGRKEISLADYEGFRDVYEDTLSMVREIHKKEKQIADANADILKADAGIEALNPWLSLDVPFQCKGTRHTAVLIGTLANEWTKEQLEEQLDGFGAVHIEVISATKDQTCVFLLCLKEEADAVTEKLREVSFTMKTSHNNRIPREEEQELLQQKKEALECIETAKEYIVSCASKKDSIQFLADYERMRSDKYHVIGKLVQSNKAMILTGYIPEEYAGEISELIQNRFDAVVELIETKEEEDVPVYLKNNGFSAPLESTVEGFSLPGKGETDPTFIMSLFYYMLFGLMLSDAAYGLIMVLGCGIALAKFKNMEPTIKKTLKMYLYCGISTVFWGVMFGSYFGDVVDVVSENFFGNKVSIPALWFVPVNEPMRMLVFSMLLGVIHLYAGLAMKFYQNVKAKQYLDAVYDVVLWYILLTSCILLLLSTEMFTGIVGLSFILPSVVGKLAGIAAVLSALGILFTAGRESRNPLKRFLKGLYGLYGISGYLSDVLSYSRLLALGLATGVICTVINKMGAMAGNGVVGVFVFTLVFIFGHSLNIGINALGAYVHTNRLQYVEFFGKFYEGGGRKFNPFSAKTKYYKIKENTNHG